jgi:sugar lactone lactonase YvrE
MRKLAILLGILVAPMLTTTAGASPFPSSIPIPDDFQPEGITVGTGDTFYVGSLWDGDIYRGDLSTGEGSVFIDVSDRQALGMEVDEGRHLLFVAGGFNGHAYVYDTRNGSTVADLDLGGSLVNDVAVTRDAAYFTDTFAPFIYKVPIARDGAIGVPSAITVTGPASEVPVGGFGMNGIKAPPDGSVLLVNHTALGILATVDPATGVSKTVDLGSGSLIPGTADGLILDGHTAWVVENFANTVVGVRLSPDFSSGTIVKTITDPLFRIPTTVASFGNRLALVNGRFDLGFPPPVGPGAPPGTDFDVVLVRK